MHTSKLHARPSSSSSASASTNDFGISPSALISPSGFGLSIRAPASSSKWPTHSSESPVLHVRKPMATYGVGFSPVSVAVHVLGLISLALTLAWVIAYRGGVSLFSSDSNQIFNAHPVIQIGGFIFIYAEAILVYKTLSGPKKTKKLVHLVLQAIACLFALLGVWAAYKFHIDNNIDNFYSFHSWLGVATVILFIVQWVAGFVSFWTQSVGPSTRAAYLPWHVFLGLFIFVLAIVTALTGIFEKITFLQKDGKVGHYDSEAMFVNSSALVVVVFGAVAVFAAIMPAPKDEDGYQPIS